MHNPHGVVMTTEKGLLSESNRGMAQGMRGCNGCSETCLVLVEMAIGNILLMWS